MTDQQTPEPGDLVRLAPDTMQVTALGATTVGVVHSPQGQIAALSFSLTGIVLDDASGNETTATMLLNAEGVERHIASLQTGLPHLRALEAELHG